LSIRLSNYKEYFYFNSSQRKGVLFLVGLIICLLVAKNYLYLLQKDIPLEENKIDELIAQLDQNEQKMHASIQKYNQEKELNNDKTVKLFKFDPNQIPKEEWMLLGLSEKQSNTILNYRIKGGTFKVKSDLKKMYSISEEVYSKLEPFITLPDSLPKAIYKKIKNKKTAERKIGILLDINLSDSAEWTKLYGIGPVLSARIVKYREKLGGFISISQLSEVYGIQDTLLNQLDSQLIVSDIPIKKIQINNSTEKQLQRHPYINWNLANAIVKYKMNHGPFNDMTALKEIKILNDSISLKLEPYLEF